MANPYQDAIARRLGIIQSIGSDATVRAQQAAQGRARAQQTASYSAPMIGGGSANYSVGNIGSGNQSNLIKFGKEAQRLGYKVGENPNFGSGRVGKHTTGSKHYKGEAVDINWAAGTSAKEQAMLRKLIPLSQQYGLRNIFMQPGHYGHAHFDTGR